MFTLRTFAWLAVSCLFAFVLSSCSSSPGGPAIVPGGINGELKCNTEAGWTETRIDTDVSHDISRTTLSAAVTSTIDNNQQKSILLRLYGSESRIIPTILRFSRPDAPDAGTYVGTVTGKSEQGYAGSQDIVYATDRYVPVVDGVPQGKLNGFTFCVW